MMQRLIVAAWSAAALLAANAAAQDFSTAGPARSSDTHLPRNWVFGTSCDYRYDDASTDDSIGLTIGGNLAWLQHFGPRGGCETISEIAAAIGWSGRPVHQDLIGTQLRAWVWDDPNNDGNPFDLGSPIAVGNAAISNVDDDVLNVVAMDVPVVVSSRFFVGVAVDHAAGQFPAAMDTGQDSMGRCWLAGNSAGPGTFDPNNVSGGNGLFEMDAIGFRSVWVMAGVGGSDCAPCDMNCDGIVDANDIEFFIGILFDGAAPCDICTGDTNGDGTVDAADIEGFINCLFP